MELRIYTKNIQLTPDAESHVQKKFERLNRHLKSLTDAKLEVSRTSARAQNERIVAQMTLTANGYTLRGQETGLNLFAAVDAVTDVMDRQIQTYKGKVYRSAQPKKTIRGAPDGMVAEPELDFGEMETASSEPLGKPVKTKRFSMKPISVEDAILEMELLSHNFFLFFNGDSDEYNVVYRRHDGDYGIIEPELA